MTWVLTVDIDGTITENGNGIIHLGALSSLRSAAASGHRVIYVTGRSSIEAYILSIFGGTGDVAVGENGGCITHEASSHTMLGDITKCQQALKVLQSHISNIQQKPVFPRMTEVVLNRTFDIKEGQDVIRDADLDVKLSDSGYAYHINSTGIDKGRGVREIMSLYDISSENIIAIGDSVTDIPMFKEAGISVTVSNAVPDVKECADIVTSSPKGDGVVEALQILAPRMA